MNNVHLRVDYGEALNAKRSSLLIQESLIKSIAHLREYNSLRKIEFSLKNKIRRDFMELNKQLISLQEHFPKEEVSLANQASKKLNAGKEEKEVKPVIKEKIIPKQKPAERKNQDLESELSDIRRKLAELG